MSVLIPTFNRPTHLRECLQAIANQTFSDLEAIVINDAGVSVEPIAVEFPQLSVQVISQPTKRGQVAARNQGLKIARGKYIAFCDDDDLWLPIHLAGLVEALETGASLAYSDAEIVVFAETDRGRAPITHRLFAFDFDPWLLRHWNFIPPSTAAYRRELHAELGSYDETMEDYWDWDWWLRIASRYPVRRVPVASVLLGVDAGGRNASADLERMSPNLARLAAKHELGSLPTSNFALMLDEPTLQACQRQSQLIWDGRMLK